MKFNQLVYKILHVVIFVLSNITCAVISYNWASMECGIRYQGYSAPAYTALFTGFPYCIVLLCCITFALLLRKRIKPKIQLRFRQSRKKQ